MDKRPCGDDDMLSTSRGLLVGVLVVVVGTGGLMVGLSVNLLTTITRVLPMLAGVAPC